MPYPPEVLDALQRSIAKWKANAAASVPAEAKLNRKDCPLCDLFNPDPPSAKFTNKELDALYERACHGCPVFLRTGQRFCDGTPYAKCVHACVYWEQTPDGKTNRAEFIAAAEKELLFLTSLLKDSKLEPHR